MEYFDVIKERYSVRKFKPEKVESDKIQLILEAGRLSPTAVNYQPQRILLLDEEAAVLKLRDCTPYHFYAPQALIICYDQTVSWKRPYDDHEMGEVDAAIVTTQMMLEIANLGLGTTWVGHFDAVVLREKFAIPEAIIPVAILPFGYIKDTAAPSPKHAERYSVEETLIKNSF